ncbi:MAG: hypothetical protein EHM24_00300 [Acidobacteria bacterium]|nr:MAG: hypothetical protein EHM24_00300 [Acidobacteriota bacterium]
MTRRVWILSVLLAAVAAAYVALRYLGPPAGGQTSPMVVRAAVDLTAPAAGTAAVRLDFDADALKGRHQLLLGFADAHGGGATLRDVAVEVDGQPVRAALEGYEGALLLRAPLPPGGATAAAIRFTVDPTYYPSGLSPSDRTPADARGRITADLAVVRSTSLLPILDAEGASYQVAFALPEGWTAVAPWPFDGTTFSASVTAAGGPEYLAFGPLHVTDITVGEATIRVAGAPGAGSEAMVETMVRRIIELLAAPLKRPGVFVATMVPAGFMHGGAAGRYSIVQFGSPQVVAHEVFHWWNDGSLTARDAGWFREGLTQHYGIRVAREVGATTPGQERACLADLEAEMRGLERAGGRSLVAASLDPADNRLMYGKGALFWLHVDGRLRQSGRFLEEAVRRVLTSDRRDLTSDELRSVFSTVYGGLLDEDFDRYVMGAGRLPDLGLGEATGRSGCAR